MGYDKNRGRGPNNKNSGRQRSFKGSGNFNKKRYNKKQGAEPLESEYNAYASGKNDPAWYSMYPNLVKDVANYPFGYAIGTRPTLHTPNNASSIVNDTAIPGIMAIAIAPLPGYSNEPTAPVNVAARNIYSAIRHSNSGATNYDSTDMMLYLLAIDSLYSLLEHMKRAYGVVRASSVWNRYVPKTIVEAMGFDYEELSARANDFRTLINTFAAKLNAFAIPNSMSYMAKHQWMFSGVYLDSPTPKAQMYMFVPEYFYQYGWDSDAKGELLPVEYTGYNTPYTIDTWKTYSDNLLNRVLSAGDFVTMSGDILKWRGDSGILRATGIDESYSVMPTYNEEVLDQIQNATLCGVPIYNTGAVQKAYSPAVRQVIPDFGGDPYLVCTPSFYFNTSWPSITISPAAGANVFMSTKYVNFEHDNVTPDQMMEATRLTNIAGTAPLHGAIYDHIAFQTAGSEVATRVYVWQYRAGPNNTWVQFHYSFTTSVVFRLEVNPFTMADYVHDFNDIRDLIKDLSVFNRHPHIALTSAVWDVTEEKVVQGGWVPFDGFMTDLNYFTTVEFDDLKRMSEAALMSEFAVRITK